jgi:hypothetical protein
MDSHCRPSDGSSNVSSSGLSCPTRRCSRPLKSAAAERQTVSPFPEVKILETVSEDRMVAAFLKAEISSPRWRELILESLAQDRRPRSIIDFPDLNDAHENEYRALLLGYRGYRENRFIFSGFPNNAHWQSAQLDHDDQQRIRVMNDDTWPKLGSGSRMAADVAESLKSGRTKHEVLNEILGTLERLRRGESLPEVILVGGSLHGQLIIMEGHVRIIANLFSNHESEVTAVIGTSEQMSQWSFY